MQIDLDLIYILLNKYDSSTYYHAKKTILHKVCSIIKYILLYVYIVESTLIFIASNINNIPPHVSEHISRDTDVHITSHAIESQSKWSAYGYTWTE